MSYQRNVHHIKDTSHELNAPLEVYVQLLLVPYIPKQNPATNGVASK